MRVIVEFDNRATEKYIRMFAQFLLLFKHVKNVELRGGVDGKE